MRKNYTVLAGCVLAAALLLLLLRGVVGPVPGLVSPRSTLNVAAVALLLLCCLVMRERPNGLSQPGRRAGFFGVAAVLLATAMAFAPSLQAPFLFDDYVHLRFVSTESWPALFARVVLRHPTGGDFFFRPIGDLALRLIFEWSGFSPLRWHLTGLFLHVANTALVFCLAVRFGGGKLACAAAALLFGWHASHVEAVCWLSAMYDLLATFFCLLALLALNTRLGVSCAFAVLACLSKESAYCLPLLAAVSAKGAQFRKAAWLGAACALVFAYRLWYLGGLGGYQTSGGSSALHLRFVSALQALALRLWGLLLLPINWSVDPEWFLKAGLLLLGAGAMVAAWMSRVSLKNGLTSLAFMALAALPVLSILLIAADLSGARILYLPSVGFALLWAAIFAGFPGKTAGVFAAACLLLFELSALLHNQAIWSGVARTAQQACLDTAEILQRHPQSKVLALDLPRTKQGVFFLQNGFPACVARHGSVPEERIRVGASGTSQPAENEITVVWDASAQKIRPR